MYNIENIQTSLKKGKDLSVDEACFVSEKMFEGSLDDNQIKEILLMLNKKKICSQELIGFATAMRKISTKVDVNDKVIDSCGTGGDGIGTFNISTCASFIAAACDVKVAKHGNKAITSSSGSADLLHDAGAKIDLEPEQVSKCISHINFGFMFAPLHHAAMKNVANSRKSLAPEKTIFNMLGPITNPANAKIQLIGTYNNDAMNLIASALLELGTTRALIINSRDGLDEASIYDITDVLEIKNNNITSYTIDPTKYDLAGDDIDTIKTNNERSSLDIIYSVINNIDSDSRKISILNAALLVMLYKEIDLKDAITQCKDSLENYLVRDKFNQYIDFTNQVSKDAK
jgi:anthranilate phosphoribosyltransferase